MSRVRDLFFDEFYQELEDVIEGIESERELQESPPVLAGEVEKNWTPYQSGGESAWALISVDGGVQISRFAYGGFVSVARACALTHRPGQERALTKKVKIHIQEVYDNRDRGLIPGYARTIAEYRAATAAAEEALGQGLTPLVLMDGSLYLSRFPYATREYRHHPSLLQELLDSITALRVLARDHSFPVAGVTKDSTVFYLYMELLKGALLDAGQGRLRSLVEEATTPMDLRAKAERFELPDRNALEPYMERRPLCDTALIRLCTDVEGYTRPLLLAPSIYYARGDAPSLYRRIQQSLSQETAESLETSLRAFFALPGVAVTYWKPTPTSRPFRVDLAAHALGHPEPWGDQRGNTLLEPEAPLNTLETVLDHLYNWYCNDVEYNIPLKQADALARFDRNLYTTKYEPFIVNRLERAGVDIRGTRRNLREMEA